MGHDAFKNRVFATFAICAWGLAIVQGNDAPPAKKPRMDDWQDGPRIDRSASFESRANVLWELAEAVTVWSVMRVAL
eukprot:5676892-Amphidinium_carterae.1